jgi:hypothetical protein
VARGTWVQDPDNIRCFSRKCHELLKVGDTDAISAFRTDTTYGTLVYELDRDQQNTTKELLDIATRYASGRR